MAGYQNFQIDKKKFSKTANIFMKSNNRQIAKPKSERLMEGVDVWCSFYRANPHRFVKDYLGVELKLFQQILLYIMMHFHFFTYIAARGQGKTYLTAIFCVTRAILFPKTKIIAASGQKSQAKEIIGKIKELMADSPLLAREISDLREGSNEPRVDFHNGSWIRIVAANDGARGARSNLLIVDEYRLVSSDIIDSVLKKFQISPRQPAFLNKPEYKDNKKYKERNKQIFLSSAWYKAHESWDRVVSYKDSMLEGKLYFTCAIPYQISIKEGLLNEEEVADDMAEKNFNEVKFQMEMEAMFWGTNLNSYFKYEELQKNRKLNKVYYPLETRDLLNDKTLKIPKKEAGEKRVVSADIATMAGAENDASVYTVARCIPTSDGFERQLVYIESLEGAHTNTQANRIRQLYHDFDCDYIVLDTQNAGIGVFDQLTEHAVDPIRGTEYTPMTCMNDDRLAERCVYPNSPKVIYSVRASGQLNSEIASMFKDTLRKGKFKFPIHEDESKDILNRLAGFDKLEGESQIQFKLPYVQTTLMITEILNLESEVNMNTGQIKITETKGARKDKYSSVSYLNYFVSNELEVKSRRHRQDVDPSKYIMVRQPKKYR